jgi:hypothetical protein
MSKEARSYSHVRYLILPFQPNQSHQSIGRSLAEFDVKMNATVALLRFAGLTVRESPSEKCCDHDLGQASRPQRLNNQAIII